MRHFLWLGHPSFGELMRYLYCSLVTVVFAFSAHAEPINRFSNSAQELSRDFAIAESELRMAIAEVYRAAIKRGRGENLDSTEIGDIAPRVVNATRAVGVISSALYLIRGSFKSVGGDRLCGERAAAIEGVFSSTARQMQNSLAHVLVSNPMEDVLASLLIAHFVVVNTAGNLLFSLKEAVQLNPPNPSQLAIIRSLGNALIAVFEEGAKAIMDGSQRNIGDRIIPFINGTTGGTAKEEGPSPLSGEAAVEVEKGFTKSLASAIAKLKTITVETRVQTPLFGDPECKDEVLQRKND